MTRRVLGAAFIVVVAVVGLATPAAAHSVTGVEPTNYRSEITAVVPSTPELTVGLLDLGNRIRLTYRGRDDLVVLGYDGEPYLRVGPGGVFENRWSSTLAHNRAGGSSTTTTTLPATAGPSEPDWRLVSDGSTATWRDRRTVWEGDKPPAVAANPGEAQVVGLWSIGLRRNGQNGAVGGSITWVPPPSSTPWLLGSLLLAVLIAPLGLLRRWGPPLSAVTALLVAGDIVHTFGNALTAEDSALITAVKFLTGSVILTAAWGVAIWAVPALQREREGGLLAAGLAALVILMVSGLSDALSLGRSELPYAFAPVTARAAIAWAMGASLGLLVAVGLVFKRHPHFWLADARDDETGTVAP